MRIGFTYDLRDDYLAEGYGAEETAEFDRSDTIEGITEALAGPGHEVVRIGHCRNLVRRLAAGERWDLVFNIAEGLFGFGREAQVPALLDVYRVPYTFSGPMVLALTLHKALTKRVVRDAGLPTPDFVQVRNLEELDHLKLPWPLFCKPVAEGTGKGISAESRVEDRTSLRKVCGRLLERHGQPVLVESYLPGREFTVGITGTGPSARVLGVMEVVFTGRADGDIYGYQVKQEYEGLVEYRLADDASACRAGEIALSAYRVLGCRDAGRVDLRCDAAGDPGFLEVNALPGLNPVHSDLPIMCRLQGIAFPALVETVLDSALCRASREEI